jgi:hypothetical protein
MSPTFRYNSDGVLVHFNYDGYHYRGVRSYCGRRVGQDGYHQPCGSCDGRCGPTNGCQCKSCYDLDMETQHRATMMGFDKKFDAEFFNRDGAICHLSFNKPGYHEDANYRPYRFYCGRYVGSGYYSNCSICSGRCGPSNGCQCIACYLLEESFYFPHYSPVVTENTIYCFS